MKLKLFVILLVIFALNIDKCLAAFRSFHRGRRYQILSVADLPLTTNIAEKFFEQRLDHFNEANKQTWKQRYWVNGNFFSKNGPVFLMIGGEGTLYSTSMVKGQWINYAKKFKALCVMLEHRYYGKSQPTSDMSTENLIYLNSEQALADLASFRNFIHRSYNLTAANKWVSFGGSYSGSLSAWLRLKYPHLIHASVSSSGPLLALIDFHKYLDVVNNSLAMYSPQCPNRVEIGMRQIQRLEATKDGRSKLDKLFKTCDNLQDDNDVTNFNSIIVGYFQEVVQYNIYGASFGIQQTCDIMMNTSLGEEINRLVVINQHFLDQSNEKCLDASNRKWIERLKNSTWDDTQTAYRQWTYQTCTEFGFFQSTDSNNQPFGQTIPLKYYIDQCQDVFGANFSIGLLESAITDTNLNYGGLEYGGTRVVFVHGNVDPWHSLGIVKVAPNLLTHAILINGTSHCADMRENANYDSLELKRAREKVAYFISNWLH